MIPRWGWPEEVQLVEQQHPVGDRRCRPPPSPGRPGAACASDIAASVSRRCRSRLAQVSAILCRATPDQPGRAAGPCPAVAGAAGPGGDEGLLGDVLGVRPGTEGADRHAVDLAGPPLVGPAPAPARRRRRSGGRPPGRPVRRRRARRAGIRFHGRDATHAGPAGRRAARSSDRLRDHDDVVAVAAELREERSAAGDERQPRRARRGRTAGRGAAPASAISSRETTRQRVAVPAASVTSDLVARRAASRSGAMRAEPLLAVVDVPGDHGRSAVARGRAEPVPADPVDVGRDGHLAVAARRPPGRRRCRRPRAGTASRTGAGRAAPGRRGRRGRATGPAAPRPAPARTATATASARAEDLLHRCARRRRRPGQAHVVGAPTARARPRTAVAAAGRTAVSCVLPRDQPRLRARRRAPAPAATRPITDSAGDAAPAASRRPPGRPVPPGTPDGAECAPLIVWTASS